MYGNEPDSWSDQLAGDDRLRFIVNAFTRMRYCDDTGRLELKDKRAPGAQKHGLRPWFDVPGRAHCGRIVFGHWSTLGHVARDDILALDTGCVWGGRLTVARLDDGACTRIAVDCPGAQRPGIDA